jgi:hypothetical protein
VANRQIILQANSQFSWLYSNRCTLYVTLFLLLRISLLLDVGGEGCRSLTEESVQPCEEYCFHSGHRKG